MNVENVMFKKSVLYNIKSCPNDQNSLIRACSDRSVRFCDLIHYNDEDGKKKILSSLSTHIMIIDSHQ